MDPSLKREIQQINQHLTGTIITGAIESESGSFGLLCSNPKTQKTLKVWVDCDPEGNGPGHLEIEEE